MYNNIKRITELSCWAKRMFGAVISFVLVGTCSHYSFRPATVQRSINRAVMI